MSTRGKGKSYGKQPQIVLADEPNGKSRRCKTLHILKMMVKLNKELKPLFYFLRLTTMLIKYLKRKISLEDGKVVMMKQ